MTTTQDDPLLKLSEVAAHLNMTTEYVRRSLLVPHGGELPAVKVGRHWRVKKSDVIDFIENRYLISKTRKPGE
jgi:excisionase family DNA binding protein